MNKTNNIEKVFTKITTNITNSLNDNLGVIKNYLNNHNDKIELLNSILLNMPEYKELNKKYNGLIIKTFIINNYYKKKLNNNNNNTKDNKNLHKKITILEHNLNKGISKKGACFWCTCDFNNESIFIPKNCINDTYYVYGNFCSPACACGYLFNENIDNSCKFERYFLLNNLYCNNDSNNKNIVPAPEPYYILDKFNGNLTIDEYRKLNDNNKYILLIKKPISKVLPELFEDNYEFKTNNKYLFNN